MRMNALAILVFNCGSSSLKFSFYRMESSIFDDSTNLPSPTESTLSETVDKETFTLKILLEGAVNFSEQVATLRVEDSEKKTLINQEVTARQHAEAALRIIEFLAGFSTPKPQVVAHRIVHGGPTLQAHCLITPEVLDALNNASHFAPLHHHAAMSVIKCAKQHFPQVPQIACFDTVFHHNMPALATTLAIPKYLKNEGMRRYGFHGLSCESILFQISEQNKSIHIPEKMIIAHLGAGCSVTAIKHGKSVDTSMSFTPTGGIMMATRAGDLDPSVLFYLLRKNPDVDALEHLINFESGLLGVSGKSSDMCVLQTLYEVDTDANLAIDLFCLQIAKEIAGMMTVLNGLDLLVFTGGIGEHDAHTRRLICSHLRCFGVTLDEESKQQAISTKNSKIVVKVITSNENAQIARHAWEISSQATLKQTSSKQA